MGAPIQIQICLSITVAIAGFFVVDAHAGGPGALPVTATKPKTKTKTKAGHEPAGIAAAAVSDDVEVEAVFGVPIGGFSRPVFVTHAGDGSGRLFVVEQGGVVRVVVGGKVDAAPWLDVRPLIGANQGEQGLLGLAFHPAFKTNGRLFVAFTDKKQRDAVAEVRVETSGAKPSLSTLRVLFAIDDPAPNHNGGHLLFGPDGKLWVGTGDGGAANDRFRNAQNMASLLGKMLRVDVDAPDVAAQQPQIWARGLRNPWRYSFDGDNGDLWIADVGQNSWEEVNVVKAAAAADDLDFGWSKMEGRVCFVDGCDAKGTVVPAIVYGHDFSKGGGCSVTGGVVSRGRFFFADYCSGEIWTARRDFTSDVVRTRSLGQSGRHVSSFGSDEHGGVWVVDHDGAIVPLTVNVAARAP